MNVRVGFISVVENGDGEVTKPPIFAKPTETKRPKELDGYVGFANLPNQVYRKAVKKGFEFTLMIVGEFPKLSGSTMMLNYSK